MAVHPPGPRFGDLREHLNVARDHAREIHDLGDADHVGIFEKLGEVGVVEFCTWALERRGGNTTRGADGEGEREVVGGPRERQHPGYAEDVRDLVGICGDRRRAVGEDGAHKLVDPQLRRLEVHVRIDESRSQRGARNIDDFNRLASPPADDDPVRDREVGLDPFAGARDKDPASRDEQVGRLVSTSDSKHPSGSMSRGIVES